MEGKGGKERSRQKGSFWPRGKKGWELNSGTLSSLS